MQVGAAVGAGIEEPAALRRAQPLVTGADIPVGVERRQVERHLPRAVRAVDQHRHAGGMAERARSRSTGSTSPLGEVIWSITAMRVCFVIARSMFFRIARGLGPRKRNLRPPRPTRPPARPGARSCCARRCRRGSRCRISSPGLSRSERRTAFAPVVALGTNATSLRLGADESRQSRRRLAQCTRHLEEEEPRRLRLHALAPAILLGQHDARRGTVRAVVDGQKVGIEAPFVPNGRPEKGCVDTRRA